MHFRIKLPPEQPLVQCDEADPQKHADLTERLCQCTMLADNLCVLFSHTAGNGLIKRLQVNVKSRRHPMVELRIVVSFPDKMKQVNGHIRFNSSADDFSNFLTRSRSSKATEGSQPSV